MFVCLFQGQCTLYSALPDNRVCILTLYTNVKKFLPFVGIPPNIVENFVPEPYVSCILSNWGHWGPCYSTCGPGIQIRQRSIRDHPDITPAHSQLFSGPPTNYVRMNSGHKGTPSAHFLLKISWADKLGQKMQGYFW